MKCGFYEREITPPIGDDIPGYNGPRFNTTIHDRLFVKAAAINTGDRIEDTVILIEMDLLMSNDTIYDIALQKIEDLTQVPQKNILLAATHSHTGGPVMGDTEFRKIDRSWLAITAQSVADCAIMAFRTMQPAEARIMDGRVEGQNFCRDFVLSDGTMRTNPGFHNPLILHPLDETDPAMPVVFFHDAQGKPFGALVNFACHHDCKSGTEISADYSGVLAREMKKAYGMDFVNLFISGACGDLVETNPLAAERRKRKGFLDIGYALAEKEQEFYNQTVPMNLDKVDAVKKVLPVPRRQVTPEQLEEAHWLLENVPTDWYQLNIANPENTMFKRCKAEDIIAHNEKPKNLPVMVQVIKLGDLAIYALPGEVYNRYGRFIKAHSKARYNMICTLAGRGLYCYIPTPEVFGSNIYPAQLPSSRLIPEGGQMMADFALEIAQEVL